MLFDKTVQKKGLLFSFEKLHNSVTQLTLFKKYFDTNKHKNHAYFTKKVVLDTHYIHLVYHELIKSCEDKNYAG